MVDNQRSAPNDQSRQFMLAEYELIRSLRSDLLQLSESRVNFFLAALAGAVVGVGLILEKGVPGDIRSIIIGIILPSLFFVGLTIYILTVERDLRVNFYARGLNRIRHYFASLDPGIVDYLILPIHDDIPSFSALESSTKKSILANSSGIIALVNAAIASICAVIVVKVAFNSSLPQMIIAAVSVFVVISVLQLGYRFVRLSKINALTPVNFPTIVGGPK